MTPTEACLDILRTYRDAQETIPHVGALRDVVMDRTGGVLTDAAIRLIGAVAHVQIPDSPWWHGLDEAKALEAVKRYGHGEDWNELAVAWDIPRERAKRLVYLGMAITGETYGRFWKQWEPTPHEERRAQELLRQKLTHKEIAQKMGRYYRWVAQVARRMDECG